MSKREAVLDNKCPNCGATLAFDPKIGKWSCKYCDGVFTLEELQKHNNASSVKNNTNENKDDVDISHVSYHCNNCGAEIIADEQTAATFCVYCGNTAILKSKLSNKFAPNRIIPFKTEKKQAIEAFKKLAKGKPLVPKDFVSEKNIEKIRGIYIPFWLYDIKVEGNLDCDAQKIDEWVVGDTHYTKTSIYKLYRAGSMEFYGVPVDGSTRFANDIMNTIEPFRYEDLTEYNHAYLSGFYAEKYDVNSDTAFEDAKKRSLESAKEIMMNDSLGYTSKIVTQNTLSPSITKTEYILLPVWMVNVKYKNEMYLFAMNGQTGEFVGNIPLDKTKAVVYGIIAFVISVLICILVSYLIFLSGGH